MGKKRSTKLADQLTDQIRQAIDESGLTRYRIAKEAGLDESTLSKIYNGRRGLSAEVLNALGEFLGLEIILRRKSNKKDG